MLQEMLNTKFAVSGSENNITRIIAGPIVDDGIDIIACGSDGAGIVVMYFFLCPVGAANTNYRKASGQQNNEFCGGCCTFYLKRKIS